MIAALVAAISAASIPSENLQPPANNAKNSDGDSLALASNHHDDALANSLVAVASALPAHSQDVIDPSSVAVQQVHTPVETYNLETEGIGSRIVSKYDNSQSALNKILNVSSRRSVA